MKKLIPYTISAIVLALLVWLVFSTRSRKHRFDDRISFNRRDKIPYGLFLAYNNLPHIFPGASISVNHKAPAYWDSLTALHGGQALVIIVPSFRADEFEMQRLIDFARGGNNVFVSAANVSPEVQTILHAEIPEMYDVNDNLTLNHNSDSFSVSLVSPPFSNASEYGCPGLRYESYFSKFDSGISTVLGTGIYVMPDLLEFKAGRGHIFFHLTPLAFTNYFLLYADNINYYDKVLSLLPKNTRQVVWDEYFLFKRFTGNDRDNSKSVFSALMSQRSFRAAVWLLVILLSLFILQEMRRKQKFIPLVPAPRNDSLDFVRTIGRLYYEKRDNKNLCLKMAAYFLDHVRIRYKLGTTKLDDEFVASLQRKTGQPGSNIGEIVSFINNMEASEMISDEQLADFHKALEQFYKTG